MAVQSTFDILPVQTADIPRLAHIHVDTCMSDYAMKHYFDSPEDFTRRVTEMLQSQVGDPRCHHVKAVDRKTGDIVSWASWKTPTDQEISEQDEKRIEVNTKGGGTSGEFVFPSGLPMFVKSETEKMFCDWTRNRRHMVLKALFTDPAYQRRGIGKALVSYGNTMADEKSLPVLLYATAVGWTVFVNQEFKVVQNLDIDLNEWTLGTKQDDDGGSNYRFRFMVRLPQTLNIERHMSTEKV